LLKVVNFILLVTPRLKNRRIVQMKERPGQPTKPNQIWVYLSSEKSPR